MYFVCGWTMKEASDDATWGLKKKGVGRKYTVMSPLKPKHQFRSKGGGKFRGFQGFPGNSGTACAGMVRNDRRRSLAMAKIAGKSRKRFVSEG